MKNPNAADEHVRGAFVCTFLVAAYNAGDEERVDASVVSLLGGK